MSNSQEFISVLGAGSWGSCLAHRIAIKGYPVTLWMRREEQAEEIRTTRRNSRYLGDYELHPGITPTTDLKEAAKAKIIVIAVPSKGFRATSRELGDYVKPDQILLSATKGIEPKTYLRMSQILKEETACLKIGVISGPNLALEVMQEHPTATIIASRFDEVVEAGMRIFNANLFRTYGSHDIVGVEMAGALKNVLAIASGMISGLGYGANTRAFLITRGLSELIRLGMHYDIDPMTMSGLAGVGDIFVTCSSEKSRNFRVGKSLGEGNTLEETLKAMNQVAEGVRTAQAAYDLAQKFGETLPIVEATYHILHKGLPLTQAQMLLLGRPMHYEHNPKRIIRDELPPK